MNWFQNCIRYIPDKTMSTAIALVLLKYSYTFFERELIHGGSEREHPKDERIPSSLPCSAVKPTEVRPTGLCGHRRGC